MQPYASQLPSNLSSIRLLPMHHQRLFQSKSLLLLLLILALPTSASTILSIHAAQRRPRPLQHLPARTPIYSTSVPCTCILVLVLHPKPTNSASLTTEFS